MKKTVALGMAVAAVCCGCATITVKGPAVVPAGSAAAPGRTPVGKLRHVVLFKFKDTATPEQIKAIEDKFRSLPGRIPQIRAFEWGTDVSVEKKNAGYTHCFIVTFEDEAGRAAYLPHPEHKALVAVLGPHLDKVLVIDYVAKE